MRNYSYPLICKATSRVGSCHINRTIEGRTKEGTNLSFNEVLKKIIKERERDMHDIREFEGQMLSIVDPSGAVHQRKIELEPKT